MRRLVFSWWWQRWIRYGLYRLKGRRSRLRRRSGFYEPRSASLPCGSVCHSFHSRKLVGQSGILFDHRAGGSIEIQDICFQRFGNAGPSPGRQPFDQLVVSFVSEGILSSHDTVSGIEIDIGEAGSRVRSGFQGSQHLLKFVHGLIDAAQVPFFGFGGGDLDGEISSAANFRNQENQDCEQMCLESRAVILALPTAVVARLRDACAEYAVSLIVGVRRELIAVKNDLSLSKCRNESADGGAIAAKGGTGATDQFMNFESVNGSEGAYKELSRNLETDVVEVCRRGEFLISEFFDIESEFRTDVSVRTFIVSDDIAVLFLELGEFDCRGRVDCVRVPN